MVVRGNFIPAHSRKVIGVCETRCVGLCCPRTHFMRLHDLAFYLAVFFIIGIALSSVSGGITLRLALAVGASSIAAAVFAVLKKPALALLSLAVIIGAVYHLVYEGLQTRVKVISDAPVKIEGYVRRVREVTRGQEVDVGNVRALLRRYPTYAYGARLSLEGTLQLPEEDRAPYFYRDGVVARMDFPSAALLGNNGGNAIKRNLLKLKLSAEATYKATLPDEEAALLSGITLGSRADFSKDLRDALAQSGTSHIAALSGYNIAVIADGLLLLLVGYLSRRTVFVATIAIIALFVLMTGGEASVTRAALMGGIMLLANEIGREYNFRNAITIVAALMLLQNPKILIFDIGFQLSFAALLGIVYVQPVIARLLRMKPAAGVFGWRKNLQATLAAQIAVLPILLMNFGTVSVSGIAANVLVLAAIPATMFLGFAIGVIGLVSQYIARVFAWLAYLLLNYELAVIKFFGSFGAVTTTVKTGIVFAAFYYIILIGVLFYISRSNIVYAKTE